MGPPTWARIFQGSSVSIWRLVDFLPPKLALARAPKFAPRGIPGLFLGYHIHPGGHFRGEYICISLEDLASATVVPEGTIICPKAHRVKEVFLPKGEPSFPPLGFLL